MIRRQPKDRYPYVRWDVDMRMFVSIQRGARLTWMGSLGAYDEFGWVRYVAD